MDGITFQEVAEFFHKLNYIGHSLGQKKGFIDFDELADNWEIDKEYVIDFYLHHLFVVEKYREAGEQLEIKDELLED